MVPPCSFWYPLLPAGEDGALTGAIVVQGRDLAGAADDVPGEVRDLDLHLGPDPNHHMTLSNSHTSLGFLHG